MSNEYFMHSSPFVPNTKVKSDEANAKFNALEQGFNKLPTEAQLKTDNLNFAIDTGTANNCVVSLPYPPLAYSEGLALTFKAKFTNTGASVLNVDGLGNKSIVFPDGSPIGANDITANGLVSVVYIGGAFHFRGTSLSRLIATTASQAAALASQTAAAASAAAAAASATAASNSETACAIYESNAATHASTANTHKNAAQTSATNAATSATNASTSATSAASSASSASTSASTATTQASTATTQASNASTSATNAANSASAASGYATNASNFATSANTAASNANDSAGAALASELAAGTHASNAASSAAAAAASAEDAADIAAGAVFDDAQVLSNKGWTSNKINTELALKRNLSDTIATAEIDNDAVTYAKLQNVSATDRLLGRSTAGAGDVEEITCTAAARSILDDASVAAIATTLGLGTGNNVTHSTLTLSGGVLDLSGSNGRIHFPAAFINDSGANTLDDYEEGTWTPTLTCATVGNLSVSYLTRNGIYTKIGRFVSQAFEIITSAFTHTTASGQVRVSGSPFNAATVPAQSGGVWSGVTKASYTDLIAGRAAGNANVTFQMCASAQAVAAVNIADLPTAGTVALNFTHDYSA